MRTLLIPPVDARGALGANHWQGAHHMKIAMAAGAWKHHARLTARSSIAEHGPLDGQPPYRVRVDIPLVNHRTADGHNYSSYEVKWIVDGLIQAGIIPGDTRDVLELVDPTFRKRQRVTDPVTVTVSWWEPCPKCETYVDSGSETQPAPWCSDECAPEDLFARGDLMRDLAVEDRAV